MKKLFFLTVAFALSIGVGNIAAQTQIPSFPYMDEVSAYVQQEYVFTLSEPSVLTVAQVDVPYAYAYTDYGGTDISHEPLRVDFRSAGTYSLYVYGEENFTLQADIIAPELITLDYNQNHVLQAGESKFLKFMLANDSYVRGSLASATAPNAPMQADFELFDAAGNHYSDEEMPAGTYYIRLTNYNGEQSQTLNLQIDAVDVSSIPSYTEIDYSQPLSKGTLISGISTDLAKYQEYDSYYDKYRTEYDFMKGFTLSVTAGKQYTFGNISSDIEVYVLKNGVLTGIIDNDMLTAGWIGYTASVTENLRVLVLNYQGSAYTLQVTESDALQPTTTLSALLDAATNIPYASLPLTGQSVPVTASTPRVQITFAENGPEMTWITPAVAYKMTIPDPNTGINIRVMSPGQENAVIIYQKIAGNYEIVTADVLVQQDNVPAGEYYMLFVNGPGASSASFDFSIWNTQLEPGATTLKALLDATTLAVSLPYGTTGNTADGVFVSELEDDYNYWNPSKANAWKVILEEESELHVRSNMALMLFESNGSGGYRQVDWTGWSGSLTLVVPAGDYWVVGAFDGEPDADFWIQIAVNREDLTLPEIVSITANSSRVGVNEDASESEIKTILSLLQLTLHLNNGQSESIYNDAYNWEIAPDGNSAVFVPYENYDFDETYQPLTVAIDYTGNSVGISETGSKTYTVYTQDNTIYVSGVEAGLPYQLFGISGNTVAAGTTGPDVLSVNVSRKGIYILRVGSQVQKVPVR